MISTLWSKHFADILLRWDETTLDAMPVRVLSFDCGHAVFTTVDSLSDVAIHTHGMARTMDDSIRHAERNFVQRMQTVHAADLMIGG